MYAKTSLFKISHTNEFIGKTFCARERFLTSRNVKRGRWVYDGGERVLIRKSESTPRAIRAVLVWVPGGSNPPVVRTLRQPLSLS